MKRYEKTIETPLGLRVAYCTDALIDELPADSLAVVLRDQQRAGVAVTDAQIVSAFLQYEHGVPNE